MLSVSILLIPLAFPFFPNGISNFAYVHVCFSYWLYSHNFVDNFLLNNAYFLSFSSLLISLFDTSFRNCCDIHVSQLQFFLRRCALVFFSSTHFYFPLSSFFPHFIPLFPFLLSSDQHGFSPIALYCPVICEINIPYHIIWMKLKKCKARVVKLMNLQDVTWCSLVERYWSFETNLLSPSIFRVYIWRLSSKSYDVTVPEDDSFSCQNCFHQQLFRRCFHVK